MHRRSLVTRFETVYIAKRFLARRSRCHGDVNIVFRVYLKPNSRDVLLSFANTWRDLGDTIGVSLPPCVGV